VIDDPFLSYFALGLLIFVVVVLFSGIIAIHDIPDRTMAFIDVTDDISAYQIPNGTAAEVAI
jgi:hypothetical protein